MIIKQVVNGRIRSLKYGKERILKQTVSNTGYLQVKLSKKNISKTFNVHSIIADTFLKHIENKNYINHKDGNKLNNSVCNLEYCTQKENIQHSWANKLSKTSEKQRSVARINGKKSAKITLQYDLQGNFIKEWNGARQIQRELNIDYRLISACCTGRQKTAGGYRWQYKDTQ